MRIDQRALRFNCPDACLVGVLDVPERVLPRGVLLVSGGPQYRTGSHRQCTLLSRMLATRGIPVMRFDYRGSGDSEGPAPGFDARGADIGLALKEFFNQVPELRETVIWGLCDGASAAALYGYTDQRVAGLILLNPWVRPCAAVPRLAGADALARLGELEFWKKMTADRHDKQQTMQAIRQQMRLAADDNCATMPQRLLASLGCFEGHLLVILSGVDPVAREFADLLARHHYQYRRIEIAGANHTFAARRWRDEVAQVSANWIASW